MRPPALSVAVGIRGRLGSWLLWRATAPTGHPCCWGTTPDGRYLISVYEYLDVLTILPITAYEVRRPRCRHFRRCFVRLS